MAQKIEFRLIREDEEAFAEAFAEMLTRIMNLEDTGDAVHILRALTDPGLLKVEFIGEGH